MRGAGVGLNRTKENDMTDNPRILSARAREAYGWKLDQMTSLQHDETAARRAQSAESYIRNSNEAIRKSIYDTPPYDTPWFLRVKPNKGE
jgi:hypothetical protein